MSVLQAVDKRIPTEAQVAKGYLAKKSEDEKKKFHSYLNCHLHSFYGNTSIYY